MSETDILNPTGNDEQIHGDVRGDMFVSEAVAVAAGITRVASSASNVTLLAANALRRRAVFYNESTAVLFLKFGITASATSYTVQLAAGATYTMPDPCYTGEIDGIWAAANGACQVTELT